MKALPIRDDVTPAIFREQIRPAARPVVMKGLAADWPLVVASREGDEAAIAYLKARATPAPVPHVRGAPELEGRLHLDETARGPNFVREAGPLGDFLDALLAAREEKRSDTLAVQGLTAPDHLPGFAEAHRLAILPPAIMPRLWIGNAAKIATHHDPLENVACVAVGRRRFTLFPPEQIGNLYMGPLHITPAGTPISMVHVTQPDLDRYPRFAEALAVAEAAELEPGDAIYIPYHWYHHVEALDRINVLVNFWWDAARADIGSPWDALMHGMMTLRNLPADQRRAWRAMFDHYVFMGEGDPGGHLPTASRGILAANRPQDVAEMRRQIIARLQRG